MGFLTLIFFFQIYVVPRIAETVKSRRITFGSTDISTLENMSAEENLVTSLVNVVKNQAELIKTKTNG
jgi:hypothetical protein